MDSRKLAKLILSGLDELVQQNYSDRLWDSPIEDGDEDDVEQGLVGGLYEPALELVAGIIESETDLSKTEDSQLEDENFYNEAELLDNEEIYDDQYNDERKTYIDSLKELIDTGQLDPEILIDEYIQELEEFEIRHPEYDFDSSMALSAFLAKSRQKQIDTALDSLDNDILLQIINAVTE